MNDAVTKLWEGIQMRGKCFIVLCCLMLLASSAFAGILGNVGSTEKSKFADKGYDSKQETGQVVSLNPGMYIQGNVYGGQTIYAGVINVRIPPSTGPIAPAFCIDLLNPIYIGDYFTASGPTPCQITWILNTLPPDPSLTSLEAAARQAAIWYFSDGFIVSDAYATVKTRAQQIINSVPNPCILPQNPPDLAIAPAYATATLPQTTLSFNVTATQEGGPVAGLQVRLSTDFGVLSSSTVTTNSQGLATFTVSNTTGMPGTAHIAAEATFQLPRGTIFDPVVTGKQKLVLARPIQGNVYSTAVGQWIYAGSIIAHKFLDLNADGLQQDNEDNLSGWTMKLYQGTSLLRTGVTNSNGNVLFDNLPAGVYRVAEVMQTNWFATRPEEETVTLTTGDALVVNFGNLRLPAVTVKKFNDINGNGYRELSEGPLDGWWFTLYRDNGYTIQDSGQTVDGTITFSNIPVGSYYLRETLTPGWENTTGTEVFMTLVAMEYRVVEFGNRLPPTATMTPTATLTPTETPTLTPTNSPTLTPTLSPTWSPTCTMTDTPTLTPTSSPSLTPTESPTLTPTNSPTWTPTQSPTLTPTESPTFSPTNTPTDTPSPTFIPTDTPTFIPSPTVPAPCEPRTLGYWKMQCRTQHHEDPAPYFAVVVEESDLYDEVAVASCATIQSNATDMYSMALRHTLVLWMNIASGKLSYYTPVDYPQLTDATTVGEAIDEIETLILAYQDLERAKDIADAICNGWALDCLK